MELFLFSSDYKHFIIESFMDFKWQINYFNLVNRLCQSENKMKTKEKKRKIMFFFCTFTLWERLEAHRTSIPDILLDSDWFYTHIDSTPLTIKRKALFLASAYIHSLSFSLSFIHVTTNHWKESTTRTYTQTSIQPCSYCCTPYTRYTEGKRKKKIFPSRITNNF